MAIGQGFVLVSPLQMACFAASIARNETFTVPTMLHDPNRRPQHTEPSGLTPEQHAILVKGMKNVISMPGGTCYRFLNLPSERVPGIEIAGKTGTAEIGAHGEFNVAWFICFAPADKPEIAVAVSIRSDEAGEYGGARNAGPIATAMLREYFGKKNNPTKLLVTPFKARVE
jgi:penicillin-binding protein 2